MIIAFNQDQVEQIEEILDKELIANGVSTALLVDMAGHVIARCKNGACRHDVHSLAAIGAGNFNAVDAMAKLVGEAEFSLLFHKGDSQSLHFSKISDDLLLITTFNTELEIGLLRMKISESIHQVNTIWQQVAA